MAFGNATKGYVKSHSGGGGGTSNYNDLSNKPSINGVTLLGNKTSEELNIGGGGGGVAYSDTETKIGTYFGSDLYSKTIEVTESITNFILNVGSLANIKRIDVYVYCGTSTYKMPYKCPTSQGPVTGLCTFGLSPYDNGRCTIFNPFSDHYKTVVYVEYTK